MDTVTNTQQTSANTPAGNGIDPSKQQKLEELKHKMDEYKQQNSDIPVMNIGDPAPASPPPPIQAPPIELNANDLADPNSLAANSTIQVGASTADNTELNVMPSQPAAAVTASSQRPIEASPLPGISITMPNTVPEQTPAPVTPAAMPTLQPVDNQTPAAPMDSSVLLASSPAPATSGSLGLMQPKPVESPAQDPKNTTPGNMTLDSLREMEKEEVKEARSKRSFREEDDEGLNIVGAIAIGILFGGLIFLFLFFQESIVDAISGITG